jgi:hypothetical protein
MTVFEIELLINRIFILFLIIVSFVFGLTLNLIIQKDCSAVTMIQDSDQTENIQRLIDFIEAEDKESFLNDFELLKKKGI